MVLGGLICYVEVLCDVCGVCFYIVMLVIEVCCDSEGVMVGIVNGSYCFD